MAATDGKSGAAQPLQLPISEIRLSSNSLFQFALALSAHAVRPDDTRQRQTKRLQSMRLGAGH